MGLWPVQSLSACTRVHFTYIYFYYHSVYCSQSSRLASILPSTGNEPMPVKRQSQWIVIFKFVNRINNAACNSTQASICTRSLCFKCPILFWYANVTQGAFLLILLAVHITNICHFPWVNIRCESYCRVDGHLAFILKDLESNLCQNTCYSAEFFSISLRSFLPRFFFFNSTLKSFNHLCYKNCC